jgi:uncharacterized membrane protein YphA (DoxX/SURF4 family)
LGAVFIAHGSGKSCWAPLTAGFLTSSHFARRRLRSCRAGSFDDCRRPAEFERRDLVLLGLVIPSEYLILCVMGIAIAGSLGKFFAPEGMEYPLALCGICLALLITGGGQLSGDLALSRSKRR